MKKFLDVVLLILFFVGLSSNFLSAQIHETAGIIFIAGVIVHNVVNRNFYKNFLRGVFNRRRIINHATIIFFAVGVVTLAISGAALAEYFSAPDLNWRSIHLGAAIFSTIALLQMMKRTS